MVSESLDKKQLSKHLPKTHRHVARLVSSDSFPLSFLLFRDVARWFVPTVILPSLDRGRLGWHFGRAGTVLLLLHLMVVYNTFRRKSCLLRNQKLSIYV